MKYIISFTLLAIALVLVLIPLFYWWNNPEFSKMQVFQKYIWHYLVAIVFVLLSKMSITKK